MVEKIYEGTPYINTHNLSNYQNLRDPARSLGMAEALAQTGSRRLESGLRGYGSRHIDNTAPFLYGVLRNMISARLESMRWNG